MCLDAAVYSAIVCITLSLHLWDLCLWDCGVESMCSCAVLCVIMIMILCVIANMCHWGCVRQGDVCPWDCVYVNEIVCLFTVVCRCGHVTVTLCVSGPVGCGDYEGVTVIVCVTDFVFS